MRHVFFLSLFALVLVGCVGDPVGDPCIPEQVPSDLSSSETFLETSSAQCVTRLCIARGLRGDPRPDCTEGCASEADVEQRVHCTCRCDGPNPCLCPDGFVCEDIEGPGSYCVRDLP